MRNKQDMGKAILFICNEDGGLDPVETFDPATPEFAAERDPYRAAFLQAIEMGTSLLSPEGPRRFVVKPEGHKKRSNLGLGDYPFIGQLGEEQPPELASVEAVSVVRQHQR